MEKNESPCNIRRWDILKRDLTNLDPEAFLKKLSDLADFNLIDVRTPEEYAKGTLPQAKSMNFLGDNYWEEFEALDQDIPTFVFCQSSRRSVRTAMFMKNGGFREVYNLDGGLNTLLDHFPNILECPKAKK
jgi:rhodanese-related sulfurtransferase